MLGWDIIINRESDNKLIASWTTSIGGTKWLDQLVNEKKVALVDNGGYPCRYEAKASIISVAQSNGIPEADSPMIIWDDYVLPRSYVRENVLNQNLLNSLPVDDILIIEAWDRS